MTHSKSLRVNSRAQLKELQTLMASAVFRPLTEDDRMQPRWTDGGETSAVAESFIKPNDRLSSFERLEIYNRVYWFRVLDCLYDDYPGVRAIVGEKKFMALATAYLAKYPSASFTLRNLGQRLEQFLREEPQWIAPNEELVLDMTRFEWAQVVAFDDAALPKITSDDVLDTPAAKLRLGLQPYLSLLALSYPVDKFFLAVQKRETDVLRDEASNTFDAMPQTKKRKRTTRLPRRARVWLAVHRFENTLYYKRLEPEAFALLQNLRAGKTVEKACVEALSETSGPMSIGPRGSPPGLTTGLRSAGFVSLENDQHNRKTLRLADRVRRRATLARPPSHPAFLGVAIFPRGQRQAHETRKNHGLFS